MSRLNLIKWGYLHFFKETLHKWIICLFSLSVTWSNSYLQIKTHTHILMLSSVSVGPPSWQLWLKLFLFSEWVKELLRMKSFAKSQTRVRCILPDVQEKMLIYITKANLCRRGSILSNFLTFLKKQTNFLGHPVCTIYLHQDWLK